MTAQLDRYLADPVELIGAEFYLENGQAYGRAMQPWQRRFFDAIFATRPDGRPRHRLIYDERRRGESKTEDIAAAALADLLTGPPRHRSFSVATATDQAGLILDSVEGFVARSPILRDIEVMRATRLARNPATGSEMKVLSSEDRVSYGVRPRLVLFDELSLQTDERLWTSLWTAIGKRADGRMVAVSMAGWDFASLAWRIREISRNSETYYFATREGSELAPWLMPENMEEQRATLHPADFSRFWECRWVEPKGSWITAEMYAAAEVGREAHGGNDTPPHYGFVDVGLVRDATAIAIVHGEGETVVLDTLVTLQGSRDEPVRLEVLEDEIIALTQRYQVRRWRFEAPQAVASVQRLAAKLPAIESRYPTSESQAKLWGNLYRLFANHRLVVYPHDALRKEALSLITRQVGGRLKVVESNSVHQDHVLALGGAAELLEEDRHQGFVAISVGGAQWSDGREQRDYESPFYNSIFGNEGWS
jgi:terminase large subunit-like protein